MTKIEVSADDNNSYLFIGFHNGSVHIVEVKNDKFFYIRRYEPVAKGYSYYHHDWNNNGVLDINAHKYIFAVSHYPE